MIAPQAHASRIVEVEASAFTVLFLTVPANTWLTLQSANCSSGADPFFHLMNASSEQALETCPNPTCIDAHHGRDTDRDGLSDFEEVFGRDDIALSRWGATPRQKDAFVEVDYGSLRNMAVPAGANPFAHLQGGVSVENWVDTVLGVYVPTTSQNHLKNPAGRPINGQAAPPNARSLRIHLDIGVAPQTPADEARFGDYGGASHRVLDREWRYLVTGPVAGVCTRINAQWSCNDATGLSKQATAALIGATAVSTGQGVYAKPVAQLPDTTHWYVDVVTSTRGVPFTADLFLGVGGEGNASLEMERLGRIREHYENDPTQVDPVRVGKFRYAVVDNDGQADGWRFVSWLQPPRTFAHELGHTFGLQHWGHHEWGAKDIECIPHYLGLMRYGDDIYMRLNELDDRAFNPANASEVNLFGPFPTDIAPGNYTFLPTFPWQYPTPPGTNAATTADLNRDGVIDTTGTWRTMGLTLNWECLSMIQGAEVLEPSQDIQGGLDLMRYAGRLYAFWVQSGQVRYRSALLGAVGNKSCSGASSPYSPDGTCLTWNTTRTLSLATGAHGVSVQAFGAQIFVAYRDSNANLVIRRYTHSGTDTWNHQADWTFGANTHERTNHTPELYIAHTQGPGTLSVAYLAQSGRFRQRSWDTSTSNWSAVELTVGPAHRDNLPPVVLLGSQPPVMKTWPDPTFAGFWETDDGNKRTYALMPNGSGQLRLYVLTGAPATWSLVFDFTQPGSNLITGAKPFLEFRYLRNGSGGLRAQHGGHFLIGFHEPVDGVTTPRFWLSRYVDTNNTLAAMTSAGVPPPIDSQPKDYMANVWMRDVPGTSISLHSDRSIDNVFGLLARSGIGGGVTFLPHADGSPNHTYRVWSDYRTIEDHVCWFLVAQNEGEEQADELCGGVDVIE